MSPLKYASSSAWQVCPSCLSFRASARENVGTHAMSLTIYSHGRYLRKPVSEAKDLNRRFLRGLVGTRWSHGVPCRTPGYPLKAEITSSNLVRATKQTQAIGFARWPVFLSRSLPHPSKGLRIREEPSGVHRATPIHGTHQDKHRTSRHHGPLPTVKKAPQRSPMRTRPGSVSSQLSQSPLTMDSERGSKPSSSGTKPLERSLR